MDLLSLFGIKKDAISLAIDEAIALIEEGNLDEAIAVIHEKALKRNAAHRRALLHLGLCHMLKGDLDEAESILKPVSVQARMDSESAAASIALEKIASERAKRA